MSARIAPLRPLLRSPSLRHPPSSPRYPPYGHLRRSASRSLATTSDAAAQNRSSLIAATSIALAFSVGLAYTSRQLLLEDDKALTTKVDHLEGTKQPSGQKLISFREVEKHRSKDDCWVIIEGRVYDVTDFLDQHPGGDSIILANAGKDATKVFKPLHPPDALDQLAPEQHLGPVDPLTMPAPENLGPDPDEKRMAEARKLLPPVESMLLIDDFEKWAEQVCSTTAWAYYRSAADREISAAENIDAFKRYYFRPRILHNVTEGSTETTFMGIKSSLPVFISPAAMAKLGHPLGEVNLTKGAGETGIVQGISINASCSIDEIMAARKEGQKVMFQIYLNKDRKASEALLKKVTDLGAAAIIFTVDAAYRSKRTRDVRAKTRNRPPSPGGSPKGVSRAPLGVSRAISGYQDSNLTWDDIKFIRKHTSLPLIVKGVQSVEDVEKCAEAGVEGVIISNHGGRQCDFAPAPIDLLYEMRATRPDLFDKIEVMMDGGVRSGADVVKALALGAKAVGLGRPFLYANGTHGQEGVERVCQILAEEITNTMRNCGVRTIEELKPELVGPAGPWVKGNMAPWREAKL